MSGRNSQDVVMASIGASTANSRLSQEVLLACVSNTYAPSSSKLSQDSLLVALSRKTKMRVSQDSTLVAVSNLYKPSALISIYGGNFKDAEDNPVSYGTLYLQLSSDAVATSLAQVPSTPPLAIPLDDVGDIVPTSIWFNSALYPYNTVYIATLFSASGQNVWKYSQRWYFSGTVPVNLNTKVSNVQG